MLIKAPVAEVKTRKGKTVAMMGMSDAMVRDIKEERNSKTKQADHDRDAARKADEAQRSEDEAANYKEKMAVAEAEYLRCLEEVSRRISAPR